MFIVSARVHQSKQKQQGNRTSTRKSTSSETDNSKNTSPKEGSNSKPPVLCVISPPPLKQKDKGSCTGSYQTKESNTESAEFNQDNADTTESVPGKVNINSGRETERGSCTAKHSVDNQEVLMENDIEDREIKGNSSLNKQEISRSCAVTGAEEMKYNEKNTNNNGKEQGDTAEIKEKLKLITEHSSSVKNSYSIESLTTTSSKTEVIVDKATSDYRNGETHRTDKIQVSVTATVESANDKKTESRTMSKYSANNKCSNGKQEVDATISAKEPKNDGHSVIVTKATIEKQPENSSDNSKDSAGEKPQSGSAERKAKMKSVKFSEGPVAVISTPVKYAKLDKQKDNIGVSVCLKDELDKNLSNSINPAHSKHKGQEALGQITSGGTVLKNNDVTTDKVKLQNRNTLEQSLRNKDFTANSNTFTSQNAVAKEIPKVNGNGKSMVIETIVQKVFNDSFIIDSETDIIAGSQKALDSGNKRKADATLVESGMSCKNMVKAGSNTPHNFLKDCLHSESLFSQDDLYCSFNTSLEYLPVDSDVNKNKNATNAKDNDLNKSDSGNVTASGNTNSTAADKINRSDTEELFIDRNNKSTEESIVSENDLELNVSESGIDTSMDLIAASNYERIACCSVSMLADQESNDSYVDLHIPYQSGQEQCFENMDNKNQNNADKNCQQLGILGNISEQESDKINVLGEFSSPKPKPVNLVAYNENDLQEDMAIALEMGDSFCSTFSTQVDSNDQKPEKAKPSEINPDKGGMGDSLTFSMMEKVLDDEENVDAENLKLTRNEFESKQSCDTYKSDLSRHISDKSDETAVKTKSVIVTENPSQGNKEINKNCDKNQVVTNSNVMKESDISPGTLSAINNMNDSFLTPTCKSAPKRARNTQGCRNSKSQKLQTVGYSTPEALRIDKKRTRGKQKSNEKQGNTRKRSVERKSLSNEQGTKGGKKLKMSESLVIRGEAEDNRRDCLANTSTESDFVPPTPPDESQSCASPLRQSRTPRGSLRIMSPFSPKLRNSKTVNVQSPKNDKVIRHDKNKMKSQTDVPKGKAYKSAVGNNNISKTRRKSQNTESKNNIKSSGNIHEANIDPQLGSDIQKANAQLGNCIQKENTQLGNNIQEENEDEKNALENDNKGENPHETDDDDDENLPASFLDLNESGIPLTQSSFTIIDVCADKRLFKTFIMEWRTKSRYALALACEKRQETLAPGSGIGGKFHKG